MTKPRAALYLRQSTYKEESISLELQETACRVYAEQRGYEVVAMESDPGISGRTWKRPGVQKVMALVEAKGADVVILWKWSRLSRSRLDWAVAADKVETLGGRIESATEPLDTSTATGRFARGVLTEMAAFESERIGDTWKEAHARRVRNGLPHTGTRRFGYTYARETGYSLDPETGPLLRRLYLDYISGVGFMRLSLLTREHGGPIEAASVKRMMDSGFGAGLVKSRGEHVAGAHEAVITEDEWKAYKMARRGRVGRPRAEESPHTYSGIVRCECGALMTGNAYTSRSGVRTAKYNCTRYRSEGGHTNAIVAPRVDEAVVSFLEGVAASVNAVAEKEPVGAKQLKQLDARPRIMADLSKNASRMDALTLKYLDADVTKELHDRLMAKLREEKEELEYRLSYLDSKKSGPAPAKLAADLLSHWEAMPPEVKREILGRLVDHIEVSLEGGGRWNPKEIRVIPAWEA